MPGASHCQDCCCRIFATFMLKVLFKTLQYLPSMPQPQHLRGYLQRWVLAIDYGPIQTANLFHVLTLHFVNICSVIIMKECTS